MDLGLRGCRDSGDNIRISLSHVSFEGCWPMELGGVQCCKAWNL